MASTTAKRTTASSRAASRATKASSMSANQLAEQLASGLTISNDKGKQKAAAPTQEQIRLSAMKAVNSASQALSTVVQSGWKKSSGKPSPPAVATSVAAAVKHLAVLRQISPEDVDIERAAMSVLGKLVALELHDDALAALGDLHRRLCSLNNVPLPQSNPSSRLHLLSIPLSSSDSSDNTTLLTLMSTYLTYSVTVLINTTLAARKPGDDPSVLEALATALNPTEPTLLTWIPAFSGLPAKQLDPILTRAYTTITKTCSSCKSNPRAIFALRIYAATCLAHTSSGTVEPDTFWDQVIKFGGAFVKSQTSSEDEAICVVLSAYSDMMTRIENIKGGNRLLLAGKGFIGFCEFWMAFAKKGGDICVVDRIAGLIKGSSVAASSDSYFPKALESDNEMSSPAGHENGHRPRKDRDVLEAARLCAAFVQMTTALEQRGSGMVQRLQETAQHFQNGQFLRALIQGQNSEDEDYVRVGGKVDRALERMRRATTTVLESSSADPQDDARQAAHSMLEGIMHVLSPLCQTPSPDPDILTRTLDTLFVLAKAKLNPADPRTYVPAHEYLVQAASLVDPIPLSDRSVDTPNYVRCISGAFHNLAGTMYQAGRHGTAVGLLKEACRLGVRALEMRRAWGGKEKEKAEEGWRQLEEQLYRRWELLGVCYSKIGERKPALEAFVECIRSFPYSMSGFAQRAAEASPGVLFELSSSTKHLATIIDRVTHLSACELLMEPNAVSLASLSIAERGVVGALVERQIDSLETSRWQEGVLAVVAFLLKDVLEVYGAQMPVRRARVLLKCLEFLYHAGPDQVSSMGKPGDLGQEAVEILQRQNFGDDVHLVQFCAQYQATAHLWLALHAHRRVDLEQSSLMSYHSDEACKILKTLIAGKVEGKKSPRKSSPKQIAVTKKPALPPPVSRQRLTRKTVIRYPVTPKPKSRKALQALSLNVVTPPRPTADPVKPLLVFDDFERFLSLLHSTARIAGLLALVLPKVHILDVARRLCEHQLGGQSEGYILASIDLAYEYVILGKTRRAGSVFSRVLNAVKSNRASDEVCVSFFLRYAESLALAEDITRSSTMYCEALALSERVDFEDKTLPMVQRVQGRVKRLERAAVASRIVALIQYHKDDVPACIDGMLQSLRLWNRAIDALSRLGPPAVSSSKAPEEANPFEIAENPSPAELSSGQPKEHALPKKTFTRRAVMDGLEWRVSEGLLTTLFSLSQAYLDRGSAREAEYFAHQAQDLAESLNAPTMVSRALAKKGEIQLYQRQFGASFESLTRAAELVLNMPGIDNVDVQRLRGIYNERMAMQVDADEIYGETLNMIEELDQAFKQFDGLAFGRKSIGSSPINNKSAREVILPGMLASVLRQRIWLLRDNNVEDYTAFLDAFLSLPHSSRTKADENALMAKLTLHAAYGRFRGDMFLSSLAESTIALPMGMSSRVDLRPSPTQDVLATLDSAENHFWGNLALIARRGSVSDVREAVVSLALIQAFQTSLGKSAENGPTLAAGLLDASAAITLRREMLETIQHKFPSEAHDDIQWPLISPDGSRLSRPKTTKANPRFSFDDAANSDDESNDTASLKDYWNAVQARYQSRMLEPTALSSTQMAGLPSNWTVIHINVTEDRTTLFVTRQEGGDSQRTPLMFCVPLKGRRDDGSGTENEEHLVFEDALSELTAIIRLSNEGTKAAVHVKSDDPEARAAWWKERGELDTRLRELLANIEFCWLGAFKTILSPRPHLTPELISELRTQFEKVFSRSLHVQDKKTRPRSGGHRKTTSRSQNQSLSHVSFDDTLLECFSTLSPKCRDEEMEDLVYFMLDLYQFHGVPVAIAEVDVTQVVVDLRTALEDFSQKLTRHKARSPDHSLDEHTFLVLDKNLQGIPWESIPILRGRSVSRIPNVDFLHDRVLFANWKSKYLGHNVCEKGAVVDPRKGYFILNPSGDLGRTEGRFKAWTNEMQEVGWTGTIGRPPSEQQFLNALRDQDLVVYFGHGGGEQYLRSHKIRNLPSCAATMLWGCSSGNLKEMGDFDRIGTPYHYMLAGCPSLVANLWDVTDRDIDKFSQSVFDKLQLTASGVKQWAKRRQDGQTSIVSAVAKSRDSCKLKYLTGAAPVVYGIPFYL